MDKKLVYGGAAVAVVAVLLLSRSGGGGGGNAGALSATLASFADTNATAVKFGAITAQRDAAAMATHVDSLRVFADMHKTDTASRTTITAQTIAQNANIVDSAIRTGAAIEQSHIASALAINLNNVNNDTQRYGIDAQKYITDSNNQLQKTLGKYKEETAATHEKYNAVNNIVDNLSSFAKMSGFGF